MRLGKPSGLKHDRRVAQYAIADWHIRRCWRSVAAWVDCCKDRPGTGQFEAYTESNARSLAGKKRAHTRCAQPAAAVSATS